MKTLTFSSALIVLFVLAGSVFAQQPIPPTITFNVPLQFNNLHQGVTQIKIICSALDAAKRQVGNANTTTAQIPPDGNINTTVSVAAHQYMEFDITTAVSYLITFHILTSDGASLTPAPNAERIEARTKAGTPVVLSLTGPITW